MSCSFGMSLFLQRMMPGPEIGERDQDGCPHTVRETEILQDPKRVLRERGITCTR
jgi:hypothetical protein